MRTLNFLLTGKEGPEIEETEEEDEAATAEEEEEEEEVRRANDSPK